MDPTKLARHQRYWQPMEKGEGGYFGITAPINDSGKLPVELPPPRDLHEQWIDVDYCLRRQEAFLQNNYFGQDAIQTAFTNFGAGVQAALLGAPYEIQPNTIWFDLNPPIKDWDNPPVFKTNTEHELYKAIDAQTRAFCEASKGRYAVAVTDIGGQMDVLFSMRGEDLLADFIEYPDEVLAAQAQLDEEFITYFNHLNEIIGQAGCGYSGWMPTVSDKPWYPIQCDLSVMISPKMFEKFILPSLDKVSTAVGQTIYHLDGPGEIQHLDMLLSLKHINAIQWVPLPNPMAEATGAVHQDYADEMSLDIYRRTLKAGKKIFLSYVHPSQVKTIFEAVGSDGVYINTPCKTRKEADELIAYVRKNWLKL